MVLFTSLLQNKWFNQQTSVVLFTSLLHFESKFKRCLTNCEKINSRQVFVVLYERFENVLICIIYVGSVGPFRPISNFPFFCQSKNSLELFNIIFENSSPKGFFWANKKKFEFSALSPDSRKLLTTALKLGIFRHFVTLFPFLIFFKIKAIIIVKIIDII